MINPKIGCYAVYEPAEEGWEDVVHQFKSICDDLRKQGMTVVEAPVPVKDALSCSEVAGWFSLKDIDLLMPLIITWSFDHYTYGIYQQNKIPVAIRSIPGIRTGSIVGGQQLGALLTDLEIEHRLFYGPVGCSSTASEMAVYAKACAVKRKLEGARFAMLGRRTPGMTPIAFDEVEIMKLFGSTVTTIGMDEFDRYCRSLDDDLVKAEWVKIKARAASVSCTDENGLIASRNYLGMKRLVMENGYDAITVGSYPDCQGTACMGISLLNDEGIVAGCEGDMNSTIAMYILSQLSDEPVHFGEMLEIDESNNTIITSHCGAAATSLACCEGFMLCPVRLANNGVCVRFKSKTGYVTYVNLVGRKNNYRMCAFGGEAVPTEMVFEGNPMKIRLDSLFRNIWEDISAYGFSHHWMTAYSRTVPVLKEFCRLTGIRGIFPDL